MMRTSLRPRGLKHKARELLLQHQKPYLMMAGLYVLLTMAIYFLQSTLISSSPIYLIYSAIEDYPLQTGMWQLDSSATTGFMQAMGSIPEQYAKWGSFLFAFRVEEAGQLLMMFIPYAQIPMALLLQLLFLVLTAPMYFALLQQLWACFRGSPKPLKELLVWYLDLRLVARSVALQLSLTLLQGLLILLCSLPSTICMALGVAMDTVLGNGLLLLSMPLSLGGCVLAYLSYAALLPSRFLLAENPELGVFSAIKQGVLQVKPYITEYSYFQLTFLPLQMLSMFSYGILDLYLIPYQGMATILFLSVTRGEALPKTKSDRLDDK